MANMTVESNLRNLLNVKELRAKIISRHADCPESILAWLKKPFMRYLQNEFEGVTPVTSLDDLVLLDLGAPPAWLVEKLKKGEAFIYIAATHPDLIARENSCVEWLSSRLGTKDEPKFLRMTAAHILEKQRRTHARLAAFAQKGFRATTGGALRKVKTIGTLTCYELVADHPEFRQELMNETVMVQHCVGLFDDRKALTGGVGEHYARNAEDGKVRLYSFRTRSGNARVTLSVMLQDGVERVEQLKGKQNRPPAVQYHQAMLGALRALDLVAEDHPDLMAVGVLAQNGASASVFDQSSDEITRYLHRFPQLFLGIAEPTMQQLWVAIPAAPELSKDITLPASLQTLIAMTDPFLARGLKGFSLVRRDVGLGRTGIKRGSEIAIFPSLVDVRR